MNSRKNNRLEFYDYSQNGAYFVTICAKDKQKIFWNNQQCSVGAVSGRPQDKLNHLGLIVKIGIEKIPLYYQNITVDKYVIMPNHVHLIIRIDNNDINGRPMTAPTKNECSGDHWSPAGKKGTSRALSRTKFWELKKGDQ